MSSFNQSMQPVFVVMIVALLAIVVHQRQDSKTNAPSTNSAVDPEIVSRFLAEYSNSKNSNSDNEHHVTAVNLASGTGGNATRANANSLRPAEPRTLPTFETQHSPSVVHSVQKQKIKTIASSPKRRRDSSSYPSSRSVARTPMAEPSPKVESSTAYTATSTLRGQFCLNGQRVQCFESGAGEISLRWPNRIGINENQIPMHSQLPCRNCCVVATVTTSRGRGQIVCHKCNCSFLFVFCR